MEIPCDFKNHAFIYGKSVVNSAIRIFLRKFKLYQMDYTKKFLTNQHFLYTDEFPPDDNLDFLSLFINAGKLKIEKLKDFAAKRIIIKIKRFLCIKYFTIKQ